MKRFSMVVAASLMGAGAATAQSFPGFEFSGFAQVEVFSDNTGTDAYGFSDFDLVFLPGGGVSSLPIGFELNAAVLFYQNDVFHTVFGGVFADFGNHRVTLGWPQSAFDHYGPRNPFSRVGLLDFEFGIASNSLTGYLQFAGDIYSPGLRYDGEFGDLSLSASYHHSSGGPDVDIYAVGVSYDLGNFALSAGAEHIPAAPFDTLVFVGVEGEIGNGMFGARYSRGGPIVSNSFTAYYDHQFNDQLTVGAAVQSFNDFSSSIYGVQAEYDFANNFYVRGGVFGFGGAGDIAGDVAVGVEF